MTSLPTYVRLPYRCIANHDRVCLSSRNALSFLLLFPLLSSVDPLSIAASGGSRHMRLVSFLNQSSCCLIESSKDNEAFGGYQAGFALASAYWERGTQACRKALEVCEGRWLTFTKLGDHISPSKTRFGYRLETSRVPSSRSEVQGPRSRREMPKNVEGNAHHSPQHQ